MHSEPIALTLETCIFLQPHCVNKFSNPADNADDADPPLENDRRSAALVALFFAWRRIFRPVQACKPGEVCTLPQVQTTYKLIFWVVAALAAVALAFPYVLPLFY